MKLFFKNKKVLVTGGTGFIGSHLVEKLVSFGAIVSILDRMSKRDIQFISRLTDKARIIKGDCTDIRKAREACEGQDIVMNLAAHVGGIQYNRFHQATMLRDNMLITSIMLEAAKIARVERFLVVSSACIYPSDAIVPTPETEGFRGEPELTNGGYGWAKRMAEKLGMYYAEEFGMKVGIVRPYNAYGPRDQFDPKTSHVIPALIKRVVDGEDPIVVWGSGNQTRAFLYVDDLVSGLLKSIELYPVPDPINLGTDEEISIRKLVEKIVKLSGKKTKIVFDTGRPDGSLRRNSDNTKAKDKISFVAHTSLDEGLAKTIDYYHSIMK